MHSFLKAFRLDPAASAIRHLVLPFRKDSSSLSASHFFKGNLFHNETSSAGTELHDYSICSNRQAKWEDWNSQTSQHPADRTSSLPADRRRTGDGKFLTTSRSASAVFFFGVSGCCIGKDTMTSGEAPVTCIGSLGTSSNPVMTFRRTNATAPVLRTRRLKDDAEAGVRPQARRTFLTAVGRAGPWTCGAALADLLDGAPTDGARSCAGGLANNCNADIVRAATSDATGLVTGSEPAPPAGESSHSTSSASVRDGHSKRWMEESLEALSFSS